VFERAGAVTACSQDLADRAIAIGAAADRMAVVPYGVDVARFKPAPGARESLRAGLGIPLEAPLIFTAGRLVRKKGFEYLIDALPRVRSATPVRLAIAGGGDLAEELRARARGAGVADRVHFLGNVPQDAVGAWFAAADVAVVPSVRDDSGNVDGLPNTVLEALASGTPLVSTPAGGIGSVIENGRTGVLVAERDPAALADAIAALLADPIQRAVLGRHGRALVEQRFGWDAVAAQFVTAYGRALAFKSLTR
jgi:glycosyltransferase involved in cell wall biosynthesis